MTAIVAEFSGPVRVELEERGEAGRVARVVIDNERRLNSLSSEVMRAFIAAMERLSADEALRVVVVTGAGGRAFVGGANIDELATLDEASGRAFITLVHRCCHAIRECPVPVIARINGWCLGGGLEIAASCDLRVAADHAMLGMPEVMLGLPSVVEAALLPRLVGWGRARQLIYTAENVDARTALDWGLVEAVVPADGLDAAVARWVDQIVAAGPKAIRLQKELFRHWEAMSPDDAAREGIRNFARAWTSDEPRRLVAPMLERMRGRKREQAG